MDTKEKLERAAIVKEKGTVYFKVRASWCSPFQLKAFTQVSENCADAPCSEFYHPLGRNQPDSAQACHSHALAGSSAG